MKLDNLNKTKWIEQVFRKHYTYCIDILVKRDGIQRSEAEDYLMDAVIILAEKHQSGEFKSDNIPGWLLTVSRNMFKAKFRTAAVKHTITLEKVENYLQHKEGMFTYSPNPLIESEEIEELAMRDRKRVEAFQKAWKELGHVCTTILSRIREGAKLSSLQEELGYDNYNSLKSTKSRCMRKLKDLVQNHLQNLRNG